jgi:hypothetical protein
MIWIILAARLSVPLAIGVPIPDVRAIFSADDMPAYVQSAGVTRFVSTRTTVRPDGALQDCAAERGSGDAKLDLYTCAIILKRAKFEPAKWVDGSPAYAIVRAPVTWAVDGEPSESEVEKAYPPDMALTVNQLPAAAGKRVELSLMLAVNESGQIVGCDQRLPASRDVHVKTFPKLLPIACQQMTSKFTALPAKDRSGKAVRSVQTASVVFITGA